MRAEIIVKAGWETGRVVSACLSLSGAIRPAGLAGTLETFSVRGVC